MVADKCRNRPVEEVALERYGNIEEYNEAMEERRILDDRDSRRLSRRGTSDTPGGGPSTPSTSGMRTPGGDPPSRRYMFSGGGGDELSRPSSRAGFRRPGEQDQGTSTPTAVPGNRIDQLRRNQPSTHSVPKVSTPIPSVFTPQSTLQRQSSGYPFDLPESAQMDMSKPCLTLGELNKLQAKVLRAKLMDEEGAGEVEEEYEYERLRYEASQAPPPSERRKEGGKEIQTEVLPTLNGSGRLYDVGLGGGGESEERKPGNRRKKEQKVCDTTD